MRQFRQFGKEKEQTHEAFEKVIGMDLKPSAQGTIAYLTNFKTTTFHDKTTSSQLSGILCYFIDSEGDCFKTIYKFSPYFYIGFREDYEEEVRAFISSKYEKVVRTETVLKVDLEELNHLSGREKKYLKLYFHNLTDLATVRKGLRKDTEKPGKSNALAKTEDLYKTLTETDQQASLEVHQIITTMREYDIPFHSRVCIDTGLRAGKWFQLNIEENQISSMKIRDDILSRPDLRVMAYDIETSKAPLKFPDAEKDCIMMISLMFDGEAYLIVNLGFCGQEVDSFYYSPKKEFECNTTIFNEVDEKALLEKFFMLIRDYRPAVITSFNGDKFDFPFVHERSKRNDLSLEQLSGICLEEKGEYFGRYISHLDCFYWVERDAYLPQGSHGLKAVTRQKLNYEPIEVEPELMVKMAKENTRSLAQYSISDAVATFYLYMKHIHDFIFALCTILPMTPDEVLRKGSGTLCQNLLMTEAFNRRIIFPNKKLEEFLKVIDGKILDTETYTGGKVECLRTGVFRADIETEFHFNPQAIQTDLIDKLDQVLNHALISMKKTKSDVSNYDEVRGKILQKLQFLRDVKTPTKHLQYPLIYHVDVAAMYPNIILTNRLQPVAVVNDSICGSCMWNNDQYDCKRQLKWEWKGEFFPLNEAEMLGVQEVLDNEVNKKDKDEQAEYKNSGQYQRELKKRIRQYSQKTYKKMHVSKSEIKNDTVCMLQNSFYVDTVKAFRDRRYDFKTMVKKHKVIANEEKKKGNMKEAKEATEMMAFYESLQLAHKIILNSYYGYVMRKGARWYSMEMAAMVTHIGGNIIGDCKNLIEKRFGKPLELDTDGIWLLLPKNFPENQTFKFHKGGQSNFSYPCMLLNKFIYNKYKNPQYYRLTNQKKLEYEKQEEMSIEFEIDGPYKAMFIPSAKQKQKTEQIDIHQHNTQLLKKRYVVFDFNNKIHEFKGFEIKRRGELQLIKILQDEIFDQYLEGKNLKECYEACGRTAYKWLNILLKRGDGLSDDKLMGYIEESKVLSKDLEEYGNQKGVAVTSAKRLSQFLGPEMTKGKGLCCYYIISAKPLGKPITERAIPTSIFQANEAIKKAYIDKWTGECSKGQIHLKDILDWDYYRERLQTMIQKMICIPAITQGLDNPLPMVRLPDWLSKKHYEERQYTQQRMMNYFQVKPKENIMEIFKSVRKDRSKEPEALPAIHQETPKIKFDMKQKIKKINPYSMKTQFSEWLKVQKQLWIKGGEQANPASSKSSWHILQIVGKKSPGSYLVWYYSNGRINSASLMLDRKYYISNPKGEKKIFHCLGNAIGIETSELNFIKQNDFYNSLDQSIYESQVPLQISFILTKGAVTKVMSNKHSYALEDFSEQFNQKYLPGIESNFMNHIYLIEIVVLQNKHSWLIFNPKLKEYIFIFVGKNARNQNFQKIARNLIEDSESSIQSHSFQHLNESLSFIEKYFKEFKEDSKSPFLVIAQTHTDTHIIQSGGVRMLYNELPVLKLPPVSIEFQNITILDWQQKTIRVVVELSKSMNDSIVKILGMARYAFAPICNVSESASIQDYATNIIYSRMLKAGGNLLWWNQYNTKIQTIYEPQFYTGKVVNQGLYTEYCVELDMVNLGLVSLVINEESSQVRVSGMNMNKKPSKMSIQSGQLDDMSKVQVSMNYLRDMIKAWIKDAHLGIEEGDNLAQNFPKWVLTKSNPMYDPLIHRRAKHTMKKVIYDILLKLKDLGAKIVYSDFEKIIINTKKRTFNEAISNIKYLINKLHEESKAYKNIPLNPLKVWNVLLFRGPHNYSGFEVTSKDGEERYVQKWDITHCFCPKIQDIYTRVIEHYVTSINQIVRQVTEEGHEDYINFVMNFEKLVTKRQKQFILTEFKGGLLEVINYLFQQYEEWKQERRDRDAANLRGEEYQREGENSDYSEESDLDEEDDSFIDNNSQLDDVLFKSAKKTRKNNKPLEQQWKDKHEIDILIANIFNQIRDPHLEDEFILVRRECLYLLEKLQGSSLRIPKPITPVYPSFDIPCDNCYRINELPGDCICGQKLKNEEFMERTVWRMMTDKGGEMYCSTCKRLQDEFIRSTCKCGGRWEFHEDPLNWVQYTNREGEEWEYVNRVLKFTGVAQQ